MEATCKQATPHGTLLEQLMNPNIAKSEREWAASEEIARLRKDEKRLDWLADKENQIGNIQLPAECVTRNPHSLRAAIDDAMLLPPNDKLTGVPPTAAKEGD